MTKPHRDGSAGIFAAAGRQLIEGGMANAVEGRFSRVVFAVDGTKDERLESCLFEAAVENGHGAVLLRASGTGTTTPNRASLAFMQGGERIEARNCVLWSDEEGPLLIVPFDARQDLHFAVGPAGLERRPGRPATMLGQGMIRAKRRLEKVARNLRLQRSDATVANVVETAA